MDRFALLQNFVRVVDAGGISAAADRWEVAKSAVSRRLSELERVLGAQLLRRTTRRLSLTDTGRSFYERAVRILADLQEAESAVSAEHGELRGRLRVAAPMSFGLLHLGPAINDFALQHPELEFVLDFNDRQIDLLQEGVDVGIRIARLPDSTLIARRLAPVRTLVCASPDYLRRFGTPREPADLARHRCLLYSNVPDPARWRYRTADGAEHGVSVPEAMRCNNGDQLCAAASAGLGVVRSPTFIAFRALARGELVPVLRHCRWSGADAYAIYPQTRHLSHRVRAFVDFLVQRFAGEPYWDRQIPPAEGPDAS